MNLGGRALRNGVMFESDNYCVSAFYNKNGDIELIEEEIPVIFNNSFSYFLGSVPFLRGILALFRIIWNARKIIGIAVVITVPIILLLEYLGLLNDSNHEAFSLGIDFSNILLLFLGLFFIRQVYGKFHGAEHKVINTVEKEYPLERKNINQETRISPRCGTNFVVYILVFKSVSLLFQLDFPFIDLLIWIVAYEIFELQSKETFGYATKPFTIVGALAQKYITTIEPSEYELKPAIIGMKRLIELENSKREC